MTPKRLLLLSYFFPPFGGAGVQRALKLCQAAPAFGWDVSVIAAQPAPDDAQDASMLADVPADLEVERTPAWRLARLPSWLTRWVPADPYLGWQPFALEAARDLLRTGRFDAVMSTSMPYTAHLVAQKLRHEFNVPWLADLRDPWTDNRFMAQYQGASLTSRWRRWIDGRWERQVYGDADLITVTAGPLRDLLIAKHGLAPEKVLLVRNGYDETDFAGILAPPRPRPAVPAETRQDATLQVLFAGSLYEGYTIEPFFAAWQRLLEQRPELRMQLTVHTHHIRLLQQLLARYPLAAAQTRVGPRVSHREVVRRYGEANLLVLSALDDLSIPGKLFEYIRSGTPVLAFVTPEAEAGSLLHETGTGQAAPHDDPAAGAAILAAIYDTWRRGEPLAQPDPQAVARLERRVAFADLFAALAGAVSTKASGGHSAGAGQ